MQLMAAVKMLFLVMLAMVASSAQAESQAPKKMSLLFQNRLPGQLNVHCFTKDSDLHLHPMAPGDDYKFFFNLNFWGTTSFHCRFNYVGTNMWQAFNVWKGPGIWATGNFPCTQCVWMINLDGFFRAKEGEPLIIIHPWRQDPEKFVPESQSP